MTHDVKSYDLKDAATALAMTDPAASDAELKGILAMASDIPEERLETAFAELRKTDTIQSLRGMVLILRMALGRAPTTAELNDCFQSFAWNDDGHASLTATIKVEADDGEAEIKITKKS